MVVKSSSSKFEISYSYNLKMLRVIICTFNKHNYNNNNGIIIKSFYVWKMNQYEFFTVVFTFFVNRFF